MRWSPTMMDKKFRKPIFSCTCSCNIGIFQYSEMSFIWIYVSISCETCLIHKRIKCMKCVSYRTLLKIPSSKFHSLLIIILIHCLVQLEMTYVHIVCRQNPLNDGLVNTLSLGYLSSSVFFIVRCP